MQRERAHGVVAAINHTYNLHLAVGHLDGFPQRILFVAVKLIGAAAADERHARA